jgi:hypothetical protein
MQNPTRNHFFKAVVIITPSHNTLNVLLHPMGRHMGEGVAPPSNEVGRLIHGTGGKNQTNKLNKLFHLLSKVSVT